MRLPWRRRPAVVLVDAEALRELRERAVVGEAYQVIELAQDAWLALDTEPGDCHRG